MLKINKASANAKEKSMAESDGRCSGSSLAARFEDNDMVSSALRTLVVPNLSHDVRDEVSAPKLPERVDSKSLT